MVKQYVGARYVPKFASPVEWAADTSYEALTIVTFNNASYTSKVQVPPTVGNPANNPQYWALTGNYNAQVEQYRQETENYNAQVQEYRQDTENYNAQVQEYRQDTENYNAQVQEYKQEVDTAVETTNKNLQDFKTDITKILQNKGVYVTPEDYGAVGDGSTDDSEAIQNAINSGKIVILTKNYGVSKTINLIKNSCIIGKGIQVCGLKWINNTAGTVISTEKYSTPNNHNTYGLIQGFNIEIPTNVLKSGCRGIYIAEPCLTIRNVRVRLGGESEGDIVENTIGIELDGCSNATICIIDKVSVVGHFETGIDLRCSHVTLNIQTAYGKYGLLIRNDSLNSSSNPPDGIQVTSIHDFYTEYMMYIKEGRSITVNEFFDENNNGHAFTTDESFHGNLYIVNGFSYNQYKVFNGGRVKFLDLQNNRDLYYVNGNRVPKFTNVRNVDLSRGSWQGSINMGTFEYECGLLNCEFTGIIACSGTGTIKIQIYYADAPKNIFDPVQTQLCYDGIEYPVQASSTPIPIYFNLAANPGVHYYGAQIIANGNITTQSFTYTLKI